MLQMVYMVTVLFLVSKKEKDLVKGKNLLVKERDLLLKVPQFFIRKLWD